LEGAFVLKLRPALENVAKSGGSGLILNEDTGLISWGDPALDVTALVVEAIDKPASGGR
jgi:hypothetical protein